MPPSSLVLVLGLLGLLLSAVRTHGQEPIRRGAIHKKHVFAAKVDADGKTVALLSAALPDGEMVTAPWGSNVLVEKHLVAPAEKPGQKEAVEMGIKEPLHTFVKRDGDYFFLTESGKVLAAAKPYSSGIQRKLVVIWTDAKRPITHVVADLDNGRTYLFGKKQDNPKDDVRFFVELTNLQANTAGAPGVPGFMAANFLKPNQTDEPLKTLLQYVRYRFDMLQMWEDINVLQSDKRLQGIITLEKIPELHDLLRQLNKLTGLSFALDKNLQDHRPTFEVYRKDLRAHEVMRTIALAQLVDGRWIKQGDGFLLTAKESTAAKAQAAKQAEDEKQEAQQKIYAKQREDYEKFLRMYPLFKDKKFLAKLSIVAKNPSLKRVMDDVSGATGVPLTLAENLTYHDPDFGHWELPNVDAFRFMNMMAEKDLDNGRWEKTADGYRLEGTSKRQRPAPPQPSPPIVTATAEADDPTPKRWRWLVTGAVGGMLIGAGAGAWWILRRRAKTFNG